MRQKGLYHCHTNGLVLSASWFVLNVVPDGKITKTFCFCTVFHPPLRMTTSDNGELVACFPITSRADRVSVSTR